DFGNCQSQAFGTRPLDEFAGARHTGIAGSDRLDRGAGRPPFGEAVAISDHSLLPGHGTYSATSVLRIPEANTWEFSALVDRVAPFLLLCHYDSGPRLFTAW